MRIARSKVTAYVLCESDSEVNGDLRDTVGLDARPVLRPLAGLHSGTLFREAVDKQESKS